MKLTLLSLIFFSTFGNFANADEAAGDQSPAQKYLDSYSEKNTLAGQAIFKYCAKGQQFDLIDTGGDFGGSESFAQCDKMSNGNLRVLYENKDTRSSFDWAGSIATAMCKNNCTRIYELKKSKESDAVDQIATNVKEADACIKKYLKKVPNCLAALSTMSAYEKNYDIEEHFKKVTDSGNSSQPVINQTNQTSTTQGSVSVASSENYGCTNQSIETIDYLPCKKFSDYAAGLEVASQAVNTGQTLYYSNKAMDTSLEATKNASTDATASLKAQKSNYKDQEAYYTQNSAMEASKAAYLATLRYAMPTYEQALDKCSKNLAGFQNEKLGNDYAVTEKNCSTVLNNQSVKFNILANKQSAEKMTAKLVKLGVNAVANGVNATFAAKRANQVDSAIAAVNSFSPTTTTGLEEAVTSTFCKVNPTAAKCIGTSSSDFSTLGDNIVDFTGNGAGGVYIGSTTDSSSTSGSSSSSDGSSSGSSSTKLIGSAITSVGKDSGIIDPASAAALQQKNGGSPGGSSGGGPGGGSVGGGSGSLPSASAQGGVTSAVTGKTQQYGSGTGISMLGGKLGSTTKKSDSSANPFGSLFDKNKASQDKLVNLGGRAPASISNKGDNIFDIIHNRYNWANENKLMLEYDDVK